MLRTVLDLLATHFFGSVSSGHIVFLRKCASPTYRAPAICQCCDSTSSIGISVPRRHAASSCSVVMLLYHATALYLVALQRRSTTSFCCIVVSRRTAASSCFVVLLRHHPALSCRVVLLCRPAVSSCCAGVTYSFPASSFRVGLACRLVI